MPDSKSLTVAKLRGELANLGLPTHGIKSDLVIRLEKARREKDSTARGTTVATSPTPVSKPKSPFFFRARGLAHISKL